MATVTSDKAFDLLAAELDGGDFEAEVVKSLAALVAELATNEERGRQFDVQVELTEKHADCNAPAPSYGPAGYN